ncbi:hypothetical protein FV219_00640 [Methylobacterium sp. WL122]|nr:hypothetical protein FV219_00640 [Methylobacterium sp. WL122]
MSNPDQKTRTNHYVPIWYQNGFLANGRVKFHYLDMNPDVVRISPIQSYTHKNLLYWGPKKCFNKFDLYTTKFGSLISDVIEKRFFGKIDDRGKDAVSFFTEFAVKERLHEAYENLVVFMDAQRARTPRGIDLLKLRLRHDDHNYALYIMQRVYKYHATMWSESVWEIVSSTESGVSFLLTDNPVSFYNARLFPLAPEIKYPNDVGLNEVGTRTIFPLNATACLIITHLQFTRKSKVNPRKIRTNARAYQSTMFDLTGIQHGRQLSADEVLKINLILKRKATRYIAAVDEDTLYPERGVSTDMWSKLDEDWFMLPNLYKIPFVSEIFAGFDNGSSWSMDEYGRKPRQKSNDDEAKRSLEFASKRDAQRAWALKRNGRSKAMVYEMIGRENQSADILMKQDLARLNVDYKP